METNAVNLYKELSDSIIETQRIQGSEFKELFDKITGGEIAEKIQEKYNVTLDVGSIGNYQELIDVYDIRCTNYVRISAQTLSNMEKNPALKNRILDAIEKFCSKGEQAEIRVLQPPVKSAGMIIYPDGKTLYWLKSYSNELGSEKSKKRIISEQFINELFQKYGNSDYKITESSLENILPAMAAGYKRRTKYDEIFR